MRPKIDFRTAGKAAYLLFKQQHPHEDVSFKQYRDILLMFNTLLVEHILSTGSRVRLPHGLGEISIAKYTPRRYKTFTDKAGNLATIPGLPINWQKTREHKKIIYHLNAHTDGYKFRWKWFKSRARFAAAPCFTFKANRASSRKLAAYLKSGPQYAQIYRQWQD